MGTELDLDDVAAQSARAQADIANLLADNERLRAFAHRMTKQKIDPYFARLAHEVLTHNVQIKG